MQGFFWTAKYLFSEAGGKAVCLVCGEQLAVFKDCNLSRHDETKHSEKYKTGLTLKGRRHHTSRDAATKTSFVISHKIAQNSKPFSEGEFVKECLVDSAALICPEKKAAFEQVPLSR